MSVQSQITNLANTIGRSAMHSLYPNDFEYYMLQLDLVNSDDEIIDSLTLPVMPDNIQRNSTPIKTIKKTMTGIVVTKTATFSPIDISITGSFGRLLKVLVDKTEIKFNTLPYSVSSDVWGREQVVHTTPVKMTSFNKKIKTGYGVTKVLQAILDKSDGYDEKLKPFKLHLYNLAFGESYVVEVKSYSFSQNQSSSNAMWQYNVSFTAVAPINANSKQLRNTTVANNIQTGVNKFLRQLKISTK